MMEKNAKARALIHIETILNSVLISDTIEIFTGHGIEQLKLVNTVLSEGAFGPLTEQTKHYTHAVEDMIKLASQIIEDKEYGYTIRNNALPQLVGSFETYLKDKLREELEGNLEIIEKFIKKHKFENRKVQPEDLLIGAEAYLFDKYFGNMVFHKMDLVSRIYNDAFGIEIKKMAQSKDISEIIQKRHRIVHHLSINYDGTEIKLELDDLLSYAQTIVNFIENVDFKIKKPKKGSKPKYTKISLPLMDTIESFHNNLAKARD